MKKFVLFAALACVLGSAQAMDPPQQVVTQSGLLMDNGAPAIGARLETTLYKVSKSDGKQERRESVSSWEVRSMLGQPVPTHEVRESGSLAEIRCTGEDKSKGMAPSVSRRSQEFLPVSVSQARVFLEFRDSHKQGLPCAGAASKESSTTVSIHAELPANQKVVERFVFNGTTYEVEWLYEAASGSKVAQR